MRSCEDRSPEKISISSLSKGKVFSRGMVLEYTGNELQNGVPKQNDLHLRVSGRRLNKKRTCSADEMSIGNDG